VNAIISFLFVSANINVSAATANTAKMSPFITSPLTEHYRKYADEPAFEKNLDPDWQCPIIDVPQRRCAIFIAARDSTGENSVRNH
jgi:hypothetical protein